jgi:hypothetical protein
MYCGVESGTAQPISLPVLAMHFESFSRQRTELWNDLVPSWIEMSENVAFAQAIGALVVVERVDAELGVETGHLNTGCPRIVKLTGKEPVAISWSMGYSVNAPAIVR